MVEQIKKLYRILISKDTWKRVRYLAAMKGPSWDGFKPIPKEDYVPQILAIILTILGLIIVGFIISKIEGCVIHMRSQ
jgi:hypothetical protein